jgi:hypothetical protein
MSVQSKTMGYEEVCAKSHEFLRRGCSYTPKAMSWAGDLLLTSEPVLKQSEVNDMRGGESAVAYAYTEIEGTGCGAETVGIPSQYKVEETDIRTGEAATFFYHIPKAADPEDETNWSLGLYQSESDCAVLMDGGDALQRQGLERRVTSICGTIDRSSGVFDAQAHYLDNRKSYSTDPDNGLLVAIRTGAVWNWEVRYAPKERSLASGLVMSDDVTAQFMEKIAALGMGHEDIFEFGMI